MNKNITPWIICLTCAIFLHIFFFQVSTDQDWFDVKPQRSNLEIVLLPEQEATSIDNASSSLDRSSDGPFLLKESIEGSIFSDKYFDFSVKDTLLTNKTSTQSLLPRAPSLLDLSPIELTSDTKNKGSEHIFSEELRDKIAVSERTQEEYLKGQIKEVNYPVTKGADGSRYVNIEGVCWRIPDIGSNEPWAVVFAGCEGQSKTFHFELNIAPNVFLGNESPFFIGQ